MIMNTENSSSNNSTTGKSTNHDSFPQVRGEKTSINGNVTPSYLCDPICDDPW